MGSNRVKNPRGSFQIHIPVISIVLDGKQYVVVRSTREDLAVLYLALSK